MGKVRRVLLISGNIFSSLGKGVITASLASLWEEPPFVLKIDPYLNYSAGKLNPNEHGEIFIGKDGWEGDLDLGLYEKMTGLDMVAGNNLTGGKFYEFVVSRSKNPQGKTLTLKFLAKEFLNNFLTGLDGERDLIIEWGGTVEDEENHWLYIFLRELRKRSRMIHISLVPLLVNFGGEIKTKPVKIATDTLLRIGLEADLLVVRTGSFQLEKGLDNSLQEKLSNICPNYISMPNLSNIYEASNRLFEQLKDLDTFKDIRLRQNLNLRRYLGIETRDIDLEILLINKYSSFNDTYFNLCEAVRYAFVKHGVRASVKSLHISSYGLRDFYRAIVRASSIILPGGFGERGFSYYKLAALIAYRHEIPILGICYGKQALTCALIQIWTSRMTTSQEVNKLGLKAYLKGEFKLGERTCFKTSGSPLRERFRNRYHLTFWANRLLLTKSHVLAMEEGRVVAFEIPGKKIIAMQFHPEFNCFPNRPHPFLVTFARWTLKRYES